ncbi:hypothetical protein ASPZODRAFT_65701 [Penicilliopsis zonata CBS 506.65]|uniref:Rgp1-domain-containing protein n=1 Tax=Penicilliopsis zonata CBS 506.65 TaxID=1073090 RepID=A0A1L9SJ69_9EURO|nr:hypothetical protein ASPZODRAFT_65701 [Penicilliopsis zonata CBS 506.65]OJJ47133.1 hypothetical protein ASPZODRAFT_65701 [Penicilliopsis zonata CBS 506.65]
MPSDMQVFVKWKDQTIFAGEDVECTITFKNVAEASGSPEASNGHEFHLSPQHQRRQSRTANGGGSNSESYFSLKSPHYPSFFSHARRSYPSSPRKTPAPLNNNRTHRLSSSTGSPLGGSHSFPPLHTPTTPRSWQLPGDRHKRSVSILSIDSEGGSERSPGLGPQFGRSNPVRGHGRSASVQVAPRRNDGLPQDNFTKAGRTPTRGLSSTEFTTNPLTANTQVEGETPGRTSRLGSDASNPAAVPAGPGKSPVRRGKPMPIDFKFPATPPTINEPNGRHKPIPSPSEKSNGESTASAIPSKHGARGTTAAPPPGHLPQLTRIISTSSVNGSNRSSGEFYSISDNNSSETLASEYTNYSAAPTRPANPRHMRNFSSVDAAARSADAQALLMGYAQISASFTVDGSLINQSAFEDVKRKGVVGGQSNGGLLPGGAAVGGGGSPANREKARKGGGFWGSLGWNSIEESISGLLSNNELDGLRDMRGVTSSRSIPLLSTPQSLLFVDLRLAPGEEQSFSFSFTLPRGLPASHRGKAIKISYNLVIGTQRPSGPHEPQRVNRINIPFRVFSGVNGQGTILGHDLMAPYVLLRDEARVQKIGPTLLAPPRKKNISGQTWSSAPEFLSYVDGILEQRARENSLQPPSMGHDRRSSYEVPRTFISCKDAIDFAILRSNQVVDSARSKNRFEIARNGRRIAVVVLNRPAHRLGETIIAAVDFTGSALPCYALRATLETSEKVTPTLAVRSNSSIYRATRRVHASFFENTLYSTRVVFSPAIPISATPTILTSGVTVDWELRFEFVTTSAHTESNTHVSGAALLETLSQDNRGSILGALESMQCESFEIAIPITVYGETVKELLPEENEGYSI